MELRLEIPVGTEAAVVIPAGVKKYTLEGKEYAPDEGGPTMVELKSGTYSMVY